MTLPAFAAKCRAVAPLLLSAGACCMAPAALPQLSIDISCTQGAQQQTHRTPLQLPIDGTDRQTDARPLHVHCDLKTALFQSSYEGRSKSFATDYLS